MIYIMTLILVIISFICALSLVYYVLNKKINDNSNIKLEQNIDKLQIELEKVENALIYMNNDINAIKTYNKGQEVQIKNIAAKYNDMKFGRPF